MRLLSILLVIPIQAWDYQDAMSESAWNTFGPRAPIAILAAQIHQESGWDCSAVSWAGAQGCAQFMPLTAEDMAKRYPEFCAPADPYDEEWAFTCRDLYLKSQLKPADSDCSSWAFGLRGYNGGWGWVRKDRKLAKMAGANPDNWVEVQPYNSGRRLSAFIENTEYPVRIFKIAKEYESWGSNLSC